MSKLTTVSPLPPAVKAHLEDKFKAWLNEPCKAVLHFMKKKKEPAKSSMKKRKKEPTKNQQGANKKLLKKEFKNQQKMPTAMGIGVG